MRKLFTIDRSLSNSTGIKVVFSIMGRQRARRDKHLHSTNVLYTNNIPHKIKKASILSPFERTFTRSLLCWFCISSFYNYNSVLAATMFLYFNNYLLNERKISNWVVSWRGIQPHITFYWLWQLAFWQLSNFFWYIPFMPVLTWSILPVVLFSVNLCYFFSLFLSKPCLEGSPITDFMFCTKR